ncbi:MAG: TerC family protein, partial [Armatimonadota bacterium]
WYTVVQIGITDLFFAIDSILVAVAMVHSSSKIWVVYFGGLLGILLLRVSAQALIGLIRKYPQLDDLAYSLVAWAGVKLGFEAAHLFGLGNRIDIPEMSPVVFWTGFLLIVSGGVIRALRSNA